MSCARLDHQCLGSPWWLKRSLLPSAQPCGPTIADRATPCSAPYGPQPRDSAVGVFALDRFGGAPSATETREVCV